MRLAPGPGTNGTVIAGLAPSAARSGRHAAGSHPLAWQCALIVMIVAAGGCTQPAPHTGQIAQTPRQAAPGRRKFEFRPIVCDKLPPAADTVEDTLYITVDAPIHSHPLPAGYSERVLEALRTAFSPPQPMTLPVYSPAPTGPAANAVAGLGDSAALRPAVAAEAEFTLGDTGAIRGRVSTSSLSPVFDRSLVDAAARADSLHLLPPRGGPDGLAAPVRFFVTVLSARPSRGLWTPLFVVRIPQWNDARPAEPVAGADSLTTDDERASGSKRNESVIVQIVIDERGQPMLSTFRLVEAHYREFARAAVKRLQETVYRPASIEGCAVKEITEMRYTFPVAGS